MNMGGAIFTRWTSSSGQVMAENLDNKSGELASWLIGTRRLAVDAKSSLAHRMTHTGMRVRPW